MIKLITLLGLALVASVAVAGPGLKVRFAIGLCMDGTCFIEMPTKLEDAIKEGFEKCDSPRKDWPSLQLYCKKDDVTVSLYFDDNSNVAGIQIAINKEKFTKSVFGWEKQGYVSWTQTVNGKSQEFWTSCQIFMSPEYLALSKEERLAKYDKNNLVQGGKVLVSSFDGKMMEIPELDKDILSLGFTQQSCIPWMGHHYYYNMSEDTQCKEDSIAIHFPLCRSNKIIGMGMNMFGVYTNDPKDKEYFENPKASDVEMIVNKGPQCLYDLAKDPGVVTLHVYYVDNPRTTTCLFQ